MRRAHGLRWIAVVTMLASAAALGQAQPTDPKSPPKPLLELPIFSDGDLVLLPVEVGGKSYTFVYDTGCSVSVFDETFWQWLGSPLGDIKANGELTVKTYRWPKVKLGGTLLITADSPVVGMDLRALREASGHDIMGILGLDWQNSLVVQADFPAGRLRVHSELPPNSGTKIALENDVDKYGRFTTRVGLPGLGATPLLVDTGCNGDILLPKEKFAVLQRQPRFAYEGQREFGFASITGKPMPDQFGTLSGFEFAGLRHQSIQCNGQPVDQGFLGLGILSHYRVTFDFSRAAMYVSDPHGLDAKPEPNQAGFTLLRRDHKTLVRNVEPNTRARKAGIQELDEIVTVNGKKVDKQRFVEIYKMLAETGNDIDLNVLRGDKAMQFKLQRADRK